MFSREDFEGIYVYLCIGRRCYIAPSELKHIKTYINSIIIFQYIGNERLSRITWSTYAALQPLPSIHQHTFLQVAGAHRVVTVELHASQIQEHIFFHNLQNGSLR